MDLATIIGVISGIGLVVGSILLNSGLGLFFNVPSIMIVAGGTVAATLIAYPLKEFLLVIGLFIKVFIFKISQPENLLYPLGWLLCHKSHKLMCVKIIPFPSSSP